MVPAGMSNVLDDYTQQRILVLGRLGWTLRRIEAATGMRRETVGGYLRAAGIAVRGRGRPGEGAPKPAMAGEVSTDSAPSHPATSGAVSTDSAVTAPTRAPSASAGEPYRELIAEALRRGRNAVAIWQDLVDDHGFSARLRQCPALRPDPARSGAGRGARGHHHRDRRRRPSR